jgi:aspartyl-tRNA synthetase
MSFVTQEDIRAFVEGLYKHIFNSVLGIDLPQFPILSYREAMDHFGSDKPDIRFGLELLDITEEAHASDFSIFKAAERVKCINPPKVFSRNEFDDAIAFCQGLGVKGMSWARVTKDGLDSSITKYFTPDVQKKIVQKTKAKEGTCLLFIADKEKKANDVLGKLRLKIAENLGIIPQSTFQFVWINDFPLFSYNADEDRWEPEHHMFSMPKKEYVPDFEKRPGDVIGDLWDITLNGLELGSGSVRVTDPALQERIMNFIGINHVEAQEKFGFLLNAYKYGAPVHGGMGLGVDRLVALMAGTTDIREVIAFPKNKNAECPMDGSPSHIAERQLKELHIGMKK